MREPEVYTTGDGGDYLNRWKRIVHIDRLIRDGEHPNAAGLARECGVSTRTIRRDLDALRDELRAPIEYVPEKRGYRYRDPSFAVPAASLSERDLFALMVAENALAQYEGTPLHDLLRGAFDKVLGLLDGEVRAEHEVGARAIHFAGLPPAAIDPGVWSTLARAVRVCEEVRITYRLPKRTEPVTRLVRPLLLVVRDREWFLVAENPEAGRVPLYYLPRVLAAEAAGTYFVPAADFSAESYYRDGFNAMHGDGRPRAIRLRFPPEHAHLAGERPWAPDQEVRRHRDGSATVTFRSSVLFEIERLVLRYGGAVQVESPPELRDSVREAAERLLARHRRA